MFYHFSWVCLFRAFSLMTSYMFVEFNYLLLSIQINNNKNKGTQLVIVEGNKNQSSSSSYRAGSTDIPDPLSPLLPIVHRPR